MLHIHSCIWCGVLIVIFLFRCHHIHIHAYMQIHAHMHDFAFAVDLSLYLNASLRTHIISKPMYILACMLSAHTHTLFISAHMHFVVVVFDCSVCARLLLLLLLATMSLNRSDVRTTTRRRRKRTPRWNSVSVSNILASFFFLCEFFCLTFKKTDEI